LKSTDGGQSWFKSLDWSYNQTRGVEVVRVNPLNPDVIWAGTTEGTYKSIDAGQTWQQKSSVIMVWDLVVHPMDTNIVVIGCGNFGSTGYGIYRTTDGGQNWNKINQGVPATFNGKIHLDISPSHPDVVYASIGNGFSQSNGASWLCKSSDKGATWNIISTQDYSRWQGWFSHDVGISPVDTNIVLTVGIGAWKSTNGGQNLSIRSNPNMNLILGRPPIGLPDGPPDYIHADIHDVEFNPTNPNLVYYGTDGGVFRSTDAGETFESCNGSYQTVQFYNGFSSSPMDSLFSLGGLQDNSTIIYDGDLAWIRVIGGDGSWTAINPSNDNIIHASWQNLNLVKSTNRGQSFFNTSVPSSGITAFIAPYVISATNPNILYAGRNVIYKTTNGGSNWTATNSGAQLDGNPAIAMAISHLTSDVVYTATAPYINLRGVYRTTNGGSSWDNITGNLPDRYPTDLSVKPTNDARVFITFSGYGTSHVFRSTDYGNTWMDVSGNLPDLPTSAVIIDPIHPDHIYVGNDMGVFVSTDDGINWYDFNEGLPDAVMVFDLSISPLNRKLRVATHGNGAYERDLLEQPVGIQSQDLPISQFMLEQNYPNPFNPVTRIRYSLSTSGQVSLKIYNTLGQQVKTLIGQEFHTSGAHEIQWDGTNDRGQQVASGVYVYRLSVGGHSVTKYMTLMK
jgi:photosystem II stability/assembly factor-like uncharacterized protein